MTLDLRKYGPEFTIQDIEDELERISASSSDITEVYIAVGAEIPGYAFEGWNNL